MTACDFEYKKRKTREDMKIEREREKYEGKMMKLLNCDIVMSLIAC